MKSLILHYQEIALKGKNRPVVHHPAGAQPARRDAGHRACGSAAADGADRDRAGAVGGLGHRARPRLAGVRRRQLRSRRPRAARHRRDLRGDPRPTSGPRTRPRSASRCAAPTSAFAMTSPEIEREIGGRIKLARGWRVDLGHPALTVRIETLKTEAFYSFGNELRRRRAADRRQRPGRLPAVGRHRFAGGGVADDAARLPRGVRPLPQLSDPVARVAGEGARAGQAADHVPVPLAACCSCRSVRSSSASSSSVRRRCAS